MPQPTGKDERIKTKFMSRVLHNIVINMAYEDYSRQPLYRIPGTKNNLKNVLF